MTDHNDLIGEFDGAVWARGWLATLAEHPNIATDEGAMIAWFSNAIMAGYEYGRAEERSRPLLEKVREVVFQAAGAATQPLLEDHPDYVFPSERVSANVDRVLAEFGIPSELAERVSGAGDAEMVAKRAELAERLSDPTPAASGGTTGLTTDATPEQVAAEEVAKLGEPGDRW